MAATRADKAIQKKIGREWKSFRGRFLFSQVRLAEALGISRRTVQIVESGKSNDPSWRAIPQAETLARFRVLRSKYESEAKPNGGA